MLIISAHVWLIQIYIQKILNRNRILVSSQNTLLYIYMMLKEMYAKSHRQYEHFQDLAWISFILFIMCSYLIPEK